MLSADVLRNPMGGLGEHVREISEAIVNKRPDTYIDVITPTYGQDYKLNHNITQRFGLRLMRIKTQIRKGYVDITRYQSEILATAIKLPKPNIIHAHDWSSFDAGRLLSMHHDIPLVVTMHLGSDDLIDTHYRLYNQLVYEHIEDMQYTGLLESHAICHVSSHYMEKFSKNFISKSRIVGNGVKSEPWLKEHKSWTFPGTRPKKLVYIGRIASMKNVDTLVKTDLPEDVDLCIIGGEQGSETVILEELKKVAKESNQIHMMGPLYGEDKIRAMKSATAGIFPSRKEPFGIVGLEWMLAQVPFAASYKDGMVEYLDEDIALNCGVSKTTIEQTIKKLFNMTEEEKKTRCEAGLKKALQYSWDKVADKTLEVYNMAIENKKTTLQGDAALLPEWISNPGLPS